MTVLQALKAFSPNHQVKSFWAAPVFRLFHYGRPAAALSAAQFTQQIQNVTSPGLPILSSQAVKTDSLYNPRFTSADLLHSIRLASVPETDFSFANTNPSAAKNRGAALRQSVDAGERRLAQTVNFLRQKEQSGQDYAEIFTELERRLLTEIGAG